MKEYYKREKIHVMSRKSRVNAYFYEVDVWCHKTAKRDDWSFKYAIFSATVGVHVQRRAVAIARVGGESVGGERESDEEKDREAKEYGRRI